MENDKDKGGAAVRGEAVAEKINRIARDTTRALMHEFTTKSGMDLHIAVQALVGGVVEAAVSPRAADAPSELSEPDMLWLSEDPEVYAGGADDFANDYAQNLAPGDEVEIGVDCAVRADSRKMRIKLVDNGDDDYTVEWEWVGVKSRAADALDSQPTVLAYVATDLDGRADVGMTREKAMERAGHGCDTIIPVYDLGNTQPTVAAQQGD